MARKRFENVDNTKITRNNLRNTLKIFSYIKPHFLYFIVGMIVLVLGQFAFMAVPAVCGEMVNVAVSEGKWDFSINQLGLILMVLVITQALFSYIRTTTFAVVSEKGMSNVRRDLYNKLIMQPVNFFESSRVGELSSRITTDVEQLQSALSITLAEFIRQIITLIVGVAILAYLTPKLSFIMLLTFPVVIIAAMYFGKHIRKLSKHRQEQLANTNTIVEESFTNFSIVKAFTNEIYESKRYGNSVDKVVGISLRFARIRGLFFAFIISLIFGCILFILWKGATMVQAGEMEAGSLLSFVLYTMVIGGAIAGFGNLYTALAGAIGATERVQELLRQDGELQVSSFLEEYVPLNGDVSFINVEFSYPSRPDVEVLSDIDINIKAGEKIALVGQSGSGKSTIVQLLMRFYDIDAGSIKLDGNEINDISLINLRRNIAIVPQDVMLFGGTIRENIAYGNIQATQSEIEMAAEQSNCKEFIDQFPEGYDSIVGERGIKLSGGQKQRIAIARAILKNPTILILDEATSSLDAESEKVVQEALDRLMLNRTSIIIAHRLATVKEVDRIYVLQSGKILEKGTHDELMLRKEGLYRHLAELQFNLNT